MSTSNNDRFPVDLPPDTPESLRAEITELSRVAQRAEASGDSLRAAAAHDQLNHALDDLRRLS